MMNRCKPVAMATVKQRRISSPWYPYKTTKATMSTMLMELLLDRVLSIQKYQVGRLQGLLIHASE